MTNDELNRSLHALAKQVSQLRGLVYQQEDMLSEALRRAGWLDESESSHQQSLQRALRTIAEHEDIIVGPWTGEVGFELLYWIPFLGWLAEQGLAQRRVTVVSRNERYIARRCTRISAQSAVRSSRATTVQRLPASSRA